MNQSKPNDQRFQTKNKLLARSISEKLERQCVVEKRLRTVVLCRVSVLATKSGSDGYSETIIFNRLSATEGK